MVPNVVRRMIRRHLRLRAAIWYARCLPRNINKASDKYNRGYDASHYIDPDLDTEDYTEREGAHDAILSAILYAIGYVSYEEQLPVLEDMVGRHHTEQVEILKRAVRRFPKYVIDVGGGRGELASIIQACGVDVTVLDPSAGSSEMIAKTASWFSQEIHHIRRPLGDIWLVLERSPDCIVMCESIEHISAKELSTMLNGIPRPCRLVIVNHIDFWPIPKHSWPAWNHVRTIDDTVYNDLCRKADRVVFRHGSHLVLEWYE